MLPSLTKLITIFHRFHPEADAETVADWLWLAARTPAPLTPATPSEQKSPAALPSSGKAPPSPATKPLNPTPEKPPHDKNDGWKSPSALEPEIGPTRESSLELHPPATGNEAKTASGLPFRAPGGRALPHPLGITRALRPLMRRIPAPGIQVLNEEATVRKIADSRIWLPVFQSRKQPWLELALVLDTSPSMRLWRHTFKELRDLLIRRGAFRDVRVWKLVTTGKDQSVSLHTETGEIPRHYRTLINPARPRLILVASDYVSPAWQGEELIQWLNAWAHEHPVSLLQVLPQHLWQQTRLRTARLRKVTSPSPAVANRYLQTPKSTLPWLEPDRQQTRNERQSTAPLPLTTLESDFLADWAHLIAADAQIVHPAFSLESMPLDVRPLRGEADEIARYESFRASLARCLQAGLFPRRRAAASAHNAAGATGPGAGIGTDAPGGVFPERPDQAGRYGGSNHRPG